MSDAPTTLNSAPVTGLARFGPLANGPVIAESVIRTCNQAIEIKTTSQSLPSPKQVALVDLRGIQHQIFGYGVAVVESFSITFTRLPAGSYDIACAITPLGWAHDRSGDWSDESKVFDRLSSAEGVEFTIWRSTNTALDSQTVTLDFPAGISKSLLGEYPGLRVPALSIAFKESGSKPTAGTYAAYIRAKVHVGGHSYRDT